MIEVIVNKQKGIVSKQVKTLAGQLIKVIAKEKVRNSKLLKKELVIVFVGTAQMKKMNLQYRGKNKVTDILSFDGEAQNKQTASKQTFGELVICFPQIKKQAKEHGLSWQHELRYMLLHGILHLLGYDHEKSKTEAERMFALQDRLFAQSFRM